MHIDFLNKFAREFLDEHYQLELKIPILINNRLSATLARFAYKKNQALRIELSGNLIKYGHPYYKLDTLKHELIHYALFVKGLPNADDDEEFINELKRLKVGATDEIFVGKTHLITCDNCNNMYEVHTKTQALNKRNNKKTACCKSTYEYVGECIYNGFENKDVMFV